MDDIIFLAPDAALFVLIARMVVVGADRECPREFFFLLGWFSYCVLSLLSFFPWWAHGCALPLSLLIAGRGRSSAARLRCGILIHLVTLYGSAALELPLELVIMASTAIWLALAWLIAPRPDALFNPAKLAIHSQPCLQAGRRVSVVSQCSEDRRG